MLAVDQAKSLANTQASATMFLPRTGLFPAHDSMNAISTYIRESLEELRLVRWPTRRQAVRFSAIVLVFTFACAVAFGLIDFGLSELVKFLLSFA